MKERGIGGRRIKGGGGEEEAQKETGKRKKTTLHSLFLWMLRTNLRCKHHYHLMKRNVLLET